MSGAYAAWLLRVMFLIYLGGLFQQSPQAGDQASFSLLRAIVLVAKDGALRNQLILWIPAALQA
jgi:hypothetical protein